jgi:hypothetical protein
MLSVAPNSINMGVWIAMSISFSGKRLSLLIISFVLLSLIAVAGLSTIGTGDTKGGVDVYEDYKNNWINICYIDYFQPIRTECCIKK